MRMVLTGRRAVGAAILLVLSEKQVFQLGWTWLVLIGTFGTFAIGYFFGPALDPSPEPAKR